MKKIPLTQGKFAIVDDEDFDWLNQWKWCAHKGRNTYYAVREKGSRKKRYLIRMHREVLGLVKGDGKQTDHKNRIGLDNRQCNLRVCSNQQNQANRKRKNAGSSKYRGVRWHNNKWVASIGKKRFHLGYYKSEIEAAKAYDRVAKKRFGNFATLNF